GAVPMKPTMATTFIRTIKDIQAQMNQVSALSRVIRPLASPSGAPRGGGVEVFHRCAAPFPPLSGYPSAEWVGRRTRLAASSAGVVEFRHLLAFQPLRLDIRNRPYGR